MPSVPQGARGAIITGWGTALPDKTLTNADLEAIVDTSDEWIVQRTGIRERRKAAPDQSSGDLATEAAREALADAGVAPEEIGLVILCTATPDQAFPATAVQVIENLELTNAGGWDLSAACSGIRVRSASRCSVRAHRRDGCGARHRRRNAHSHPRLHRPHYVHLVR